MNTLRTIPSKKERFRTIPSRFEYFPRHIDTSKLSIEGYVCGQRVDSAKGITFAHFDCISYLTESSNAMNGEKYIQALGYRKFENRNTVLILKLDQ